MNNNDISWDARQYMRFERQRTEPARDLARHIRGEAAKVADVGCGPGNSTEVLRERFPRASLVGLDWSEDMLEKARARCPYARFERCDAASELPAQDRDYDAVFSNACLQWLPDHERLIGELMGMLNSGGTLAVQIPDNFGEPVHLIIKEVASHGRWASIFSGLREYFSLTAGEYYDILRDHTREIDVWRTTYMHILPSREAIMEWYRGTGLRPYLQALDEADRPLFEAEVYKLICEAYPTRRGGEVIFPFPRLFFTAVKP